MGDLLGKTTMLHFSTELAGTFLGLVFTFVGHLEISLLKDISDSEGEICDNNYPHLFDPVACGDDLNAFNLM